MDDIQISGLSELAQRFPDTKDWRRLVVYIRRTDDGAEVFCDPNVSVVEGAYAVDGDLWCRDDNDELRLLVTKPMRTPATE